MERHPGGSGANTAAWLGALGAAGALRRPRRRSPTCAATRGRSRRAASTRAWPATRARRRAASSSSPTTARCSPTAGRTSPSGATTCPTSCSTASTHVHVSGYALLEEGPRAAVLDLVARAGVPWSVDPASSAFVADTPFLEWTAGASLCFPNEDEAAGAGRRHGRGLRGRRAQARARGRARRCAAGRRAVDVPASTAVAVDQTGAGDAFAAGYLAAHVQGEDDLACARAAVRAATEAVSRPGARPR